MHPFGLVRTGQRSCLCVMNGGFTMTTPTFAIRHSHAGLRAFVIVGLCAALTAGFLFETSRSPSHGEVACAPAGSGTTKC
jgi:hypothetical protein